MSFLVLGYSGALSIASCSSEVILGLYPKQDNVDFVYDNMDAEDQYELNEFKYKINLPGIDAIKP